ncbi:hypothetical protein [Mesorhizobium sp. 10J20-29]
MRTIFLIILLAGVGAGLVYPWAVSNFSGSEIGSWRVHDRGEGFKPVVVRLSPDMEPVRVLVDMTAIAPPEFAAASTVLTLTATNGTGTVLADRLTFAEAKPQERNPQLRERIYRDEAGVIDGIEAGEYTFVVGQGDAEDIQIKSVDLILRGGAARLDARVQPVGFTLAAVGFIGLVLAIRRRRRVRRPAAPAATRWGRNGNGDA